MKTTLIGYAGGIYKKNGVDVTQADFLAWMGKLIPRGPGGERCPAYMIGNAVEFARTTTGEEADERAPIASAAAQLGKLGEPPMLPS